MSGSLFLWGGSALISLWGVAHLVPTSRMRSLYREGSDDTLKIFTMSWIAEGIGLIFIGIQMFLLLSVFGWDSYTVRWVARINASLLLVLAGVTFFTGAKTSIGPLKFCPFVKFIVGMALWIGPSVG